MDTLSRQLSTVIKSKKETIHTTELGIAGRKILGSSLAHSERPQ